MTAILAFPKKDDPPAWDRLRFPNHDMVERFCRCVICNKEIRVFIPRYSRLGKWRCPECGGGEVK